MQLAAIGWPWVDDPNWTSDVKKWESSEIFLGYFHPAGETTIAISIHQKCERSALRELTLCSSTMTE